MIPKIAAGILCALLAVNLFLFATDSIGVLTFWAVLAIIALFAYFILPRIKSRFEVP